MPDPLDALDQLAAVAAMVGGCALGAPVAFWVGILLHELAHAAAARLVGAQVLQGVIGSGRHVMPVRWFGAPWELRLLPTHGQVHVDVPQRAFRARFLCILIAGPIATTVVALGFVGLWSRLPDGSAPGSLLWTFAAEATLWTAMPASLLAAVLAWLPLNWRIAGVVMPSDVLTALRLLAATGPQLAQWAQASAAQAAALRNFDSFLAGEHERALREWRTRAAHGVPPFQSSFDETLYTWPVEGPAAAMAVLQRAEGEFAAWRREKELERNERTSPSGAPNPRELRRYVRLFEMAFLVQRAFFGVVSGRADLLADAVTATDEMLRRFPREPAVQRTAGLVELHRGHLAEGMRLLRAAWLAAEPVLLRALTALYLALGCSMWQRHAEAQRWLRRCRRLHPQCVLLPEYEARIRAAAAAAADTTSPRTAAR